MKRSCCFKRFGLLKTCIYAVLIIGVVFSQQACNKENDTKPESELVGIWKMYEGYNYEMSEGEKLEGTRERFDPEDLIYLEFRQNGQTLSYDINGGELVSGSYKYDVKNQKIEMFEARGDQIFEVIKLDQKELDINVRYNNNSGVGTFQELYFRRSSLGRR